MKHILIVVAACLICVGQVRAGELKIMVPVDDYKQMRSKMESLEKENSQLKKEVSTTSAGAAGGIGQEEAAALQSRLNSLERENLQLKQAVNSRGQEEGAVLQSRLESLEQQNSSLKEQLQAQQEQVGAGADRVSTLEQENSRLQKELAEKQSQEQMPGPDSGVEARLAEAERQNSQLKQEIKILKEGGVTAALLGDKSTAREMYAKSRHVRSFHNFTF